MSLFERLKSQAARRGQQEPQAERVLSNGGRQQQPDNQPPSSSDTPRNTAAQNSQHRHKCDKLTQMCLENSSKCLVVFFFSTFVSWGQNAPPQCVSHEVPLYLKRRTRRVRLNQIKSSQIRGYRLTASCYLQHGVAATKHLIS